MSLRTNMELYNRLYLEEVKKKEDLEEENKKLKREITDLKNDIVNLENNKIRIETRIEMLKNLFCNELRKVGGYDYHVETAERYLAKL